jgi:hypothetical protein
MALALPKSQRTAQDLAGSILFYGVVVKRCTGVLVITSSLQPEFFMKASTIAQAVGYGVVNETMQE